MLSPASAYSVGPEFAATLPSDGITAKSQMQWQEYMSNTAHQRELSDLKAAGLNPVLSAGGSGASTPSGSQDSAETIQLLRSAIDAVTSSASALSNLTGSINNKYVASPDVVAARSEFWNDLEEHEGLSPTGYSELSKEEKIKQAEESFSDFVADVAYAVIPGRLGSRIAKKIREDGLGSAVGVQAFSAVNDALGLPKLKLPRVGFALLDKISSSAKSLDSSDKKVSPSTKSKTSHSSRRKIPQV